MRIPLAWLNLVHSKMRTALAVSGVGFAVVLIFMQLGFLGSAEQSATLVFQALDFDVLLRSRHYLHLVASRTFPRDRLDQAESLAGVTRATPVYLGLNYWRNPHNGSQRAMLLFGVQPTDPVFRVEPIQRKLALLTVPEFVLVDEKSRREFGPQDGRGFSDADIGVETELSQQRVRIVGHFRLGMGFVADGAAITSVRGFQRIRPGQAPEEVSLGLVKLQPGADTDAVAAALRRHLPEDVEVLTRVDVLGGEVRHWVWETSIGLIFQLGVIVALIVGVAIVYQVLSSDVTNHLPEYATLKAMGYSGNYLAAVVLQQAVVLALLGFLPGLALSTALYALTRAAARIPIDMTPARVLFVLGLTVAMCTISGLGALRKVRSADPADLFNMNIQHRVPLAWRNLTHDRRRLLVAISGIGFAVVLMFMQTGFKNALFDSTVQVLHELNADLVLVAKSRYALPANQTFPLSRIYQARACDGVRAAQPLYIERTRAVWKQPDGRGYPIRVLACDPAVLLMPEVSRYAEALKQPRAVLIDEKNKSIYGPPGSRTPWTQWHDVTLAGQSVRLVGTFRLGTDFANDGNLFTSAANFAKFFPSRAPRGDPLEVVDLGVVQLQPGADPQKVKGELAARLPDDVAVLTKSEMIAHERNFWSKSTPVGYIFLLGTVIGFLVGVIICYQIIQADVADHMPEFATLKAMGYRNRYFVGFVLMESVYLSLLSFVPGMLVSFALYEALARSTGLLMILNVPRAASVLLLTLAMCVASGCLAMRKVVAADPAELF